jgi:O-succinylbenzoic acid--CoA ligase
VIGAGPADLWVGCLTPAHIGGLLVLLRGAVLGAPVRALERFEPSEVLDRSPGGTFVSLVPPMLRALVDTGADLSRFAALLVGGGALDDRLAARARARGGRVVATYGLTETCGGVVYDGRPFPGTELRVEDTGEIQLRGPTLMEGYRFDPQATGAAFTLDGWLRTGDAGELTYGSTLSVRGRLDDAIRTGAETVWPQEVEAALRDHATVADVAVAGRPDPEWGQHVVAFVVPANLDRPPRLGELRDHAAERVARFKAPRELVLVPSLPRTASGKIRRSALREEDSG